MIAGTCRILLAGFCIAGAGLALRFAPGTQLPSAGAAPRTASQPEPGPRLAPAEATGRFVGAGSCAAAACHGGAVERDPKGSEYSVWIQSDRHAVAYTTLFSRRSQEIVRKLGLKPAHTEKTCLACHSLAADASQTAAGRISVLADGVSCEACHGAALHWLEPHKRGDWKTLGDAEKAQFGFNDTKSILARTTACLDCHVGSEGRDVNHDLIAAGHPRLYFEMSAYLARLPPHWDRARDHQRHPALEAELWAVGQFATAEKALGLLEQRSSLQSAAPWPEFAEYACFACHHDLAAPSWRQELDFKKESLGHYRWGSWNFALVEGLVRTRHGDAAAKSLHADLSELEKQMGQPILSRGAVVEQANGLRAKFHEMAYAAGQGQYNADDLQRLMSFLARDGVPAATGDWENATQLYLALVAIAQGQRELSALTGAAAPNPEMFGKLQELRDLLRFPAPDGKLRYSSPGKFDPTPTGLNLSARIEQLREIIDAKQFK